MPSTLRDLTELAAVAAPDDLFLVSDTSDVINRDKKISRLNLVGSNITGGGSINTGGFSLTVPATGNAVIRNGNPVAANAVRWTDTNRVEDAGVAFDQMVKRIGSFTTLDMLTIWHDTNTVKGTVVPINDVARLSVGQTYTTLNTFNAGVKLGTGQTTLSMYQEGTWTPALTFGGTANGLTYSASGGQIGRYIRIGTMVSLWGMIRLTAVGSSVGNALISGMPFASANVNFNRPPATIWPGLMSFTGVLGAINVNNTTDINLQVSNNGVTAAATNTNFTNTSSIYLNYVYECA